MVPKGMEVVQVIASVEIHSVSGREYAYTLGQNDVEIIVIQPDSFRIRFSDGTMALHPLNSLTYFHIVDRQEVVPKDETKNNKKAD